MNRADLRDELERLGTRPVPLPDLGRLEALEERLLREFAVAVASADPVPTIASARRRRRQVLVAGLGTAAAALATAMVLDRGGEPSYEVNAATGAVAMYPDGARRPVQAGDRVPAGGLILTGPTGGVTIEETTVGADHVILLDEEKITLLPGPPSARPAEALPAAPITPAPVATAPATVPPTAAPVTLVPTIAPPAPPAPAAIDPAPLSLSVTGTRDGVQLSWTPTDAAYFARYIVVRGTAGSGQLEDVGDLSGREGTAFTDFGAPIGELCYRVVAVDADGLPVAASETITFVFEGTGSSNEIPPSTGTTPTTQQAATAPGTAPPPPTTAVETTVAENVPDTGAGDTASSSPLDEWPDHDGDHGDGGWWRDRGNGDWDQDDGG